ncbi:MAG: SRPBCC family protein [Chloroflexota bacterium]|nr:SRPBCC family protein [Chloroflexota bacterium]
MRLQRSIDIARPPAVVFAALTSAKGSPAWGGDAVELQQTEDGQIGLGSTARVHLTFLNRSLDSTYEITAFDPGTGFTAETLQPFPVAFTWTVASTEGGARVTGTLEMQPGGFARLAGPLVKQAAGRQLREGLEALKEALDDEPELAFVRRGSS